MPKTERYYSQQYSLVDNPSSAPPTDAGADRFVDHQTEYKPSYPGNPSPAPFADSGAPKTTYSHFDDEAPLKSVKQPWSRRRKIIIFGSIAAAVVVIGLAVGLGVGLTRGSSFSYTPLFNQVTNDTAFTNGGATHNSPWNTSDGIGAGQDKYTYYSGTPDQFPASNTWISFEDMWAGNLHTLQTSCKILKQGKDNTESEIQDVYDAIQNRANVSLVDHRFIFAIILQESKGCVRDGSTTSSGGVRNPGLMQSHNGHEFVSSHANASILAMVQDGTQGTPDGSGLVQNLDLYGNAYSAARGYNSGYIPKSGNLSEAAGATACYVSDVANRLTGWANATSTCPGDQQ